jgi:hypothetical protein
VTRSRYRSSAAKMLRFYQTVHESGMPYKMLVKMDDDAAIMPGRLFRMLDRKPVDINGDANFPDMPTLQELLLDPVAPRWLGDFRSQDRVHRNPTNKW